MHLSHGRRSFLRALGLGAAALPLGATLSPFVRRAAAGGAAAPARLVLFPGMNGADPAHFWPNPGRLSELSLVTSPLARWADRTTFVRGLDVAGSDNHFAVRSIFTGQPIASYDVPDPAVSSLDQLVAAAQPAALRSLHLGVRPADSYEYYQLYGRSTLFFTPSGPVDYEASPVAAFDRAFAGRGVTPPPDDMAIDLDAEALAIVRAEADDLARRAAPYASEAEKIEQHRAALAAMGRPITPGEGPGPIATVCDATPIASVEALRGELTGNPRAAYRDDLFERLFDAQIDVAARALTCGLTNVATIQAGSADGNVVVPVEGGHPHHNTSHGDQALFARMQRWYVGKLARLLAALDVPDPFDPGRTVLDNSCVLWLSECLPSSHASSSVPCFYVGDAGGRLRRGGYLDVAGATNRHLLRALSRAYGVPDGASAHFGDAELREVRS